MKSVRNYTSFGPYRPAALEKHLKAKKFFEADRGAAADMRAPVAAKQAGGRKKGDSLMW
ncbi:MAG: hypothetical protein ACXWCH_34335 [Burkholderiales bacterium]